VKSQVGHLVTPKTDPGDYVVAQNADLILKGGEFIDLFEGTTFLNGCNATLTIEYEGCVAGKSLMTNNNSSSSLNENKSSIAILQDKETKKHIEQSEIRIYPNPSSSTITITNIQNIPIDYFEIYDIKGNLQYKKDNIGKARVEIDLQLQLGTYFVLIHLNGIVKREKLIVL